VVVAFSYSLTGSGWAKASLVIEGGRADMTASYLSDALGDLCEAMLRLLEGEETTTTSFVEEPGEYRWLFTRRPNDQIHVRILSFADEGLPEADGEVLLDAECSLDKLARRVVASVRELERTYGKKGYRKKWKEHDLPVSLADRITSRLDKPGRAL
jgi:hypothetical protein